MAGENVVSIVVKADDDTAAGFAKSKASSVSAAEGYDDLAAAQERVTRAETELSEAQIKQTDAMLHLESLQKSGTASAEEIAAAQDRVTTATLRTADAQIRLGAADAQAAGAAKAAGDAAEEQGAKTDATGSLFAGAGGKMKMAAVGVAVGLGLAVKSAADFQQQTTKLVTSAGESAANLKMVQQGILSLSSATNTSTEQLASGMYMVESAGFHGAAGLQVLKAAAQGAQAEGADLSEVTNAVTSGLNAYGLKAKDAVSFTDQMVAAVGAGKMTMQDLAGSLSAVLPIAASAHISFAQVGGAIATMTAQGMSARQAAQDLANSIRALLNPNSTAVTEMNQFGISSVDVANKLGQRGLTGTISYLADTIAKQMGPSGDIILKTFNQSRVAAQDAETMLKSLPQAIQGVARAYLDGSLSTKSWTADLKAMPPLQANLAREFAGMADKAHGFNSLLTSGSPAAQTFAAALGKMMGGATGLNTALMLTGSHSATFAANVKSVGDAAHGAGSDVSGWSVIQKEANFQIGSAEKAVKAMGDSLGLALLPAITAVLHPLTALLTAISGNKAASIALAAVVGGVLAGALGSKLKNAFSGVKDGVTAFGDGLAWLAGKLTATAVAEEEAAVAGEEMDAAMDASPVGLIVVAIAALVAGIIELITHWHAVEDAAKDAWHGIEAAWSAVYGVVIEPVVRAVEAVAKWFTQLGRAVMTPVDQVLSWVRDHWKLLVAIILGPLGLVIDALATHWHAVEDGFKAAWDFVSALIRTDVGAIIAVLRPFMTGIEDLFSAGWHAVEAVWHAVWSALHAFLVTEVNGIKTILSWFSGIADMFRKWWDDAVTAVRTEIDKMMTWVGGIAGRVNSALGGLPGMMFRAGVHAIESLIDGITSMIGKLGNVMSGVASKVAGFFGLSPAKEGPLSGGGAPEIRGQHFAEAFAAGMLGGQDTVHAAAMRLAGAAGAAPGSGAYPGGSAGGPAAGPLTIQFQLGHGSSGLDQMFMTWLKGAVREGGGDPRIFTRKVAFI